MRSKRRLLIPLIIGAAILLFFNRLAFSGLILARGDTFLYFYPYWEAAASALFGDGRVPLWNDSLFMGAPFLANSQTGLFYPLNWPFWALFPTPYAVSASILLHLLIAGCGAYLAARRCYQVGVSAALLAALLFALGGYLTAQVEHVNQLQALAWLPWYFAVWGDRVAVAGNRRSRLRLVVALSALFALQFTAGHLQSLFISGVGFAVWLTATFVTGWRGGMRRSGWVTARRTLFLVLLPAGALALALVAGQLLPTLELMQLSGRQGGLPLNEALSFSLHPLLLTRALLPVYGQTMFTEYVAFVPMMGLLLALVGAWSWRGRKTIIPLLTIALLGLFFAFGLFNPIYVLLARLPGFSYFRVPARWLALYGFGLALLAGIGWQQVRERGISRRQLTVGLALFLGLMLWSVASAPLAGRLPLGSEVSLEPPSALTWSGWLIELILIVLLFRFWPARWLRLRPGGIVVVVVAVLFLASRLLPYNNLTTPAAYSELRPPLSRLLVYQDCRFYPESCEQPPGRLLSLSEIFFDLGDQGEIESAYSESLPDAALYDYLVASKQKAVLAPNLPLAYGLDSVDGFDGGILPLRDYSLVTSLLLPEGEATTDGRLREQMTEMPEDRWLDMFNARFLITDKVGDVWHEEVFFDRQLRTALAPGEQIEVGHIPDFEATELWLLSPAGEGDVLVGLGAREPIVVQPTQVAENVWRAEFSMPLVPQSLMMQADENGDDWLLDGVALVDARDGAFQALSLGAYRMIHSGDVKIYENLDVLPRAFMVHAWEWQPNTAGSVTFMADKGFEPARQAVITGSGEPGIYAEAPDDRIRIVLHQPERISITTESSAPGLLILADAYYPGWTAEVDGAMAEIMQVNGLFRGVFVPAGKHDLLFEYQPTSYYVGRLISLGALLLWLVLLWIAWKPDREEALSG